MRAAGSRSDGGRDGMARERWQGTGGEAEAAAARRTSCDNAIPGSVSARTWMGSESATRGTDLGQKEAAKLAVAAVGTYE
jgi:hypothetical protein